MQAGVPMVVSDIPAQAALVREHDAGIVLDEVTAPAIAAAVRGLAEQGADRRKSEGERLRGIAHERYCWEVESEKLRQLYVGLLG